MWYGRRMSDQLPAEVEPLDIVGAVEIVDRAQRELGAEFLLGTVRSWEKRRRAWDASGRPTRSASRPRDEPMPDPAGQVNGGPAWRWSEIVPWLDRTGKANPE